MVSAIVVCLFVVSLAVLCFMALQEGSDQPTLVPIQGPEVTLGEPQCPPGSTFMFTQPRPENPGGAGCEQIGTPPRLTDPPR